MNLRTLKRRHDTRPLLTFSVYVRESMPGAPWRRISVRGRGRLRLLARQGHTIWAATLTR